MKIVPTTPPEGQEVNLESLLVRKAELKQKIIDQKQQVSVLAQNLLTPASISTYVFRSFTKGMNLFDGVLIGYKFIRTFKRLFRRFK